MARSPSRRDDRHGSGRRDDRGPLRRSRSRDREVKRYVRSRSRSPHGGGRVAGSMTSQHHRRYDHRDRDRDDDTRRDRSPDRPRAYRSLRRDSSRDRKRSRDRRSDRDRRRDAHDPYDDRDRKRARRDESPRQSRRGQSRERRASRSSERSSRPRTAEISAEDAKAAKLAKVEAWKKRMQEKKQEAAGIAGTPSSQALPETTSTAPNSPAAMSPLTEPVSPAGDKVASPAPYAGKFDPKAIAKRAAAAMEKSRSTLGDDVVIPKFASSASAMNASSLTNVPKGATAASGAALNKSVTNAKITGFGLNKTSNEKPDRSAPLRAAAPLAEEEEVSRKLEKLPDLPDIVDSGDAALANEAEDQDEGDDLRSDEEEAEAARQAAQKRAEAMQANPQDIAMANTESSVPEASTHKDDMDVDDDEIDPLDAFMDTLEKPSDGPTKPLLLKGNRQVFNSDDEDELDAVGNNTEDLLTITSKRKKKDIPTVNHAKMEYEPFRKNFYNESVEVAEMTDDEVAMLRADLDNISLRGTNPPKPITKWSQGGFGAQILDVIREMKYEKPTSIQSQALPAIMSGRDVIGVAKTGSGKTMAFLLPLFRHIKDQRPVENLDGPIGLILAPTRELATQIHRDCKPFLKALNLRAVCAYGGAPIKDQIAELKRGAEIVVCTAGRFIDLLAANSGRVTNLKRVTYVVLDEADRMFDMGFEPQITKILSNIRPQRQTVLFSATFPKNMESLARKNLTKPVEITVGGRSVVAPEITQAIEVRDDKAKFLRTLELLGELHDRDEDARSLIFVERQEMADKFFVDLTRKGYPCVTIHGGRDQVDRDSAISDFKAGIAPVMIATSVAARGLDVKQLKLVINYDSPNHIEDYVHRVGRTGRAGNTGTAVTFVTPEQDRFAPFLIKALTDSKQSVPEPLQKLQEAHQEKVKAGNAQKTGSGFGGRGIERFEAARDAQRAMEKGKFKTGDEAEEDEAEDKKKESKEEHFAKLLAKASGGVKSSDAPPAPERSPSPQPNDSGSNAEIMPSALANHLNNAMKVQKVERPAGKEVANTKALSKVAAAVASINSRLGAKGTTRPGVPIDNRGPDAGAFHATLEINDFPQKARWSVTNRTNVAKILDATGTSITTKGNYYPPPREPDLTASGAQPKLYILVEGDTEVQVTNAMTELTRLLKEGTIAALDSEARAPASGRYSVV